jgi:flagellar biosynthesis protein FlgN
MNPGESLTASLLDLLEQEREACKGFVALLELEYAALSRNDADQILRTSREKLDQMQLQEELAARRSRLVAAAGLSAARDMEQWLYGLGSQGPVLVKTWHELLAAAVQAKRLNQRNGTMIESKMQMTAQALQVLGAASAQLSTYGPDGHTRLDLGGRTLGQG